MLSITTRKKGREGERKGGRQQQKTSKTKKKRDTSTFDEDSTHSTLMSKGWIGDKQPVRDWYYWRVTEKWIFMLGTNLLWNPNGKDRQDIETEGSKGSQAFELQIFPSHCRSQHRLQWITSPARRTRAQNGALLSLLELDWVLLVCFYALPFLKIVAVHIVFLLVAHICPSTRLG